MIFLDSTLMYIREFIGALGVAVIAIGAVRSLIQLLQMAIYKKGSTNYIRLQFGNSVILGLEFMIGGDIIGTLVKPDYYTLGMLAIIVAIRTVLSYFLNRELQGLTPQQQHDLK